MFANTGRIPQVIKLMNIIQIQVTCGFNLLDLPALEMGLDLAVKGELHLLGLLGHMRA